MRNDKEINIWQNKIDYLNHRAWENIESIEIGEVNLEDLQGEAQKNYDELVKIGTKIREELPEIYKIYAKKISESILDNQFIITNKKIASMRYGFAYGAKNKI